LTEWYVNRPAGLEQGFELEEPESRRPGPLVVTMAVSGDLEVSAGSGGANFANRSRVTVVRYAGLKAWDADGRPLRSRLEPADGEVRLLVEAPAARFPVTVDPIFVHEAQLFGHADSVGQTHAEFGFSVSVSGDTAVVGAPLEDKAGALNAGSAYVFVRSGTAWILQQKLLASDGAASDRFGDSVAVSGDTVVVGANRDSNPGGANAGSAYVFVRSGTTWTEQQKLLASDGAQGDQFGTSVSASGDTVVVGAPWDTAPLGVGTGSAYVFVRSGTIWTEQQKLAASDAMPFDHFGSSVSVSGDTLVAGAQRDDTTGGEDAGSAYVFVRIATTWTEQQKLVASDGAAFDTFGIAVSITADTVAVGASRHDGPAGVDTGSAYVFVRSGSIWTEQQKLVASDAMPFDHFGFSVAVSGDTVVAGARHDDAIGGLDAGSAYVFVRSGATWTEQQKLAASDGAAFDNFGIAVSVDADTVVIGAYADDILGGPNVGSAYVFVRSVAVWTEQQKLLPAPVPDNPAFDNVGWSVSVSGDTVVVGAPDDNTAAGSDTGSAYVFVRSGTIWTEQQKLVASDAQHNDEFGYSVSLSGDIAVIGAVFGHTASGPDVGAAYVFVRTGATWTEQQKLAASSGAPFDWFGFSVSVSGDTVVVGAAGENNAAGVDAGSAYVFVKEGTSWIEQQKLLASDAAAGDLFGWSVSISAETVVIGAAGDNTPGGTDAGSAYVFVRAGTSWTEQQKLVASDGAQGDAFGSSASVSGETVVVGAPDPVLRGGPGAAYVFVRSGTTWSEQQKLLASDGADADIFGTSVSVSGEVAVIGAPFDDTPSGPDAGSAYVFVRSGTTWAEQQKLLAPDAAEDDEFGTSVSASANTVVVGAYWDDTASGTDAGSAHVFGGVISADLGMAKTDGQTTATPGKALTYTIVASNAGPGTVAGAAVADMLPATLLGATWTCSASAGSTCTPSGSGNINDSVDLAVGGTATYTVTGIISPDATGPISNTATVTPPAGGADPNPSNNTATDVDLLKPEVDLGIAKTDSADPVSPGDPLTYVLSVDNAGPSDSVQVSVSDPLPPDVTFVSSSPGPPACILGGGTLLSCNLGAMPAGGVATVTINVTVNASAGVVLLNTATVFSNETDPDPSNNAATATTKVRGARGELTHGMDIVHDLAAQPGPVADKDVFLISQKPFSSYEVVVDATSGDIGVGTGPLLQRMGPDGITVLQDSAAVGAGPSRSLRWRNATSNVIEDQTVRVASAQCGTSCGPDDEYRIRAYETTYTGPRFNNAGTQITVLVLQNPTSYPIAGDIYFDVSGQQVAAQPFSLAPKATLVLNTSTVPGAGGVGGAITVAHDGRYGDLLGKTVALEPATGFSFDAALEPRPK
jgi:uncharacterized repeat protein (TIGR01451 family)